MTALLLHLHGPMQSWGGGSRFNSRTTERAPTKSAVVGLLAAAAGRPRSADISDLSSLQIIVRVDRPGLQMRDYHTVGAEYPKGTRLKNAEGKERSDALVTERFYLADAAFTVAVHGPEAIIRELDAALKRPKWALALGRRSCPPAEPFHLGLTENDPFEILESIMPVARNLKTVGSIVQFTADDPAGALGGVKDQPGHRLNSWGDYTQRTTRTWTVEMTAERCVEDAFMLVLDQRTA